MYGLFTTVFICITRAKYGFHSKFNDANNKHYTKLLVQKKKKEKRYYNDGNPSGTEGIKCIMKKMIFNLDCVKSLKRTTGMKLLNNSKATNNNNKYAMGCLYRFLLSLI